MYPPFLPKHPARVRLRGALTGPPGPPAESSLLHDAKKVWVGFRVYWCTVGVGAL